MNQRKSEICSKNILRRLLSVMGKRVMFLVLHEWVAHGKSRFKPCVPLRLQGIFPAVLSGLSFLITLLQSTYVNAATLAFQSNQRSARASRRSPLEKVTDRQTVVTVPRVRSPWWGTWGPSVWCPSDQTPSTQTPKIRLLSVASLLKLQALNLF